MMDYEKKFIQGIWEKVEEQEQNIKILKAMEIEQEQNMGFAAKNILKGLGVRGLLNGIADVIAVSMVISICIFAGIYLYLGFDAGYIYSMVFIFSPTLYASIFCLSYIKEMQLNTIHVQMSCRYTFLHVMVFRMLLNSGLAVLFNLVYVCTLNSQFEMNLWKALALSFSALMVFSVMLLKSLRIKNRTAGFVGACMVWFGMNLLMFSGMNELYMEFINQIPMSILIAATILFGAFYFKELERMLSTNYKRGYLNA